MVNHFYNEVVGPFGPPERRLIERGYGELPFPFQELQAPPFRMLAQWSLPALLGYLRTWSAARRYIQAKGADPVVLIDRDLRAIWNNPDEARTVAWPLSVRMGRSMA